MTHVGRVTGSWHRRRNPVKAPHRSRRSGSAISRHVHRSAHQRLNPGGGRRAWIRRRTFEGISLARPSSATIGLSGAGAGLRQTERRHQ
jgi:hypothetical protein